MSEPVATHVTNIRVYYEDTDSEGIVYYANYLKFAERGRTEMLRAAGIDHPTLWDVHGVGFAVRRVTADYRSPARLDDALTVHSSMTEIRGASLSAEQTVRRGVDTLVHLQVRLACVDRAGRPARMPPPLRAALHAIQNDA
ncbi:MAG: tol-pal system-associated acyl-CoA thioesterase [Proteobacteria bacterium]|jgi:acyl-CoA thioester hydrolase|nr:tol-pal system-associated acyl-CoA thioesterase [Pseudomonadota bacterium]